jgi:hypothetical protein
MEPEAIYTILGIFGFACLISRRPSVAVEDEAEDEDSDILPELMDDLLNDLRAYATIAREVSVKRANGDVIEVKFRSDEPIKAVHNVASVTPEPSSKMVWSEDGRMLHRMSERETMSWGGEQ